MKKRNILTLFFLAVLGFLTSCSKEDASKYNMEEIFNNGFFVLNEGNFNAPNGSVSYISDEWKLEDDIFSRVNAGQRLGETPQSMAFYNDFAFIVVNGSNTIEIVSRYTFKNIIMLKIGLLNPRYIAFANGKAYVTNWGDPNIETDDYVAVINLSNYSIERTISVSEGPEKIVAYNGKLYVAQKGGYGYGDTITVIDIENGDEKTIITVGAVPNSMGIKDNVLYVLCSGMPVPWNPNLPGESGGKLVKISLDDYDDKTILNFETTMHPANLVIMNQNIYYTMNSGIYAMTLFDTVLPANPLFIADNIYGFAIRDDKIYIADAGNYADPGKVFVYSSTGILQYEFTVGISPNGFYFN